MNRNELNDNGNALPLHPTQEPIDVVSYFTPYRRFQAVNDNTKGGPVGDTHKGERFKAPQPPAPRASGVKFIVHRVDDKLVEVRFSVPGYADIQGRAELEHTEAVRFIKQAYMAAGDMRKATPSELNETSPFGLNPSPDGIIIIGEIPQHPLRLARQDITRIAEATARFEATRAAAQGRKPRW